MSFDIVEFDNGKCQVWSDENVLRPCTLEWEEPYQKHHKFMYFDNIEAAKIAIEKVKRMNVGYTVKKVHRYE